MTLMELITKAETVKPVMGSACNKCGWCCMTQTCPVAKDLGAGEMIPCKFLKVANATGEYLCSLAGQDKLLDFALDIGGGCDARTQNEQLRELGIRGVIGIRGEST